MSCCYAAANPPLPVPVYQRKAFSRLLVGSCFVFYFVMFSCFCLFCFLLLIFLFLFIWTTLAGSTWLRDSQKVHLTWGGLPMKSDIKGSCLDIFQCCYCRIWGIANCDIAQQSFCFLIVVRQIYQFLFILFFMVFIFFYFLLVVVQKERGKKIQYWNLKDKFYFLLQPVFWEEVHTTETSEIEVKQWVIWQVKSICY